MAIKNMMGRCFFFFFFFRNEKFSNIFINEVVWIIFIIEKKDMTSINCREWDNIRLRKSEQRQSVVYHLCNSACTLSRLFLLLIFAFLYIFLNSFILPIGYYQLRIQEKTKNLHAPAPELHSFDKLFTYYMNLTYSSYSHLDSIKISLSSCSKSNSSL